MLLVTQKLWPVIKDSNFKHPAWISILDIHRISMRYPYWISIGYPWDIHTWISMGYPYLDIRGTFGYPMDIHRIFQIPRATDLDSNFKFPAQTGHHRSQIR